MTAIMIFIIKRWRWFAGAAVLALAGLMVNAYGRTRYKAGAASIQARWDADAKARAEAATAALNKQAAAFAKQQENAHARHQEELQKARADAGRAAAAADSLRQQLTIARGRIPTAACPAVTEYATAATDVFEQCVSEYREMAATADGHVADIGLMQRAWPVQTFSGSLMGE